MSLHILIFIIVLLCYFSYSCDLQLLLSTRQDHQLTSLVSIYSLSCMEYHIAYLFEKSRPEDMNNSLIRSAKYVSNNLHFI